PPASPRPAETAPHPSATTASIVPSAPAPAPSEDTRFRLELSLSTAGRVGDGHWGLAFGARTLFDFGGWLVGLEGAGAQYQGPDAEPATSSLLLALLGG